MRKVLRACLLLTLLLCLSCGGRSSGGKGTEEEAADPVKVRLAEAVTGDMEESLLVSGEVLATDVVRVTPDAAGILSDISVKPGDPVRAGQIIARVDPSRPGMSYEESPVRSRTGGTVIRIPVTRGNRVSPESLIAEIGNLRDLEIECHVPETYLPWLQPGLTARVTSRAYPDDPVPALVSRTSPVVDPLSRTVLATLKPEISELIRPGQSVTVELILAVHRNGVKVPEAALTERGSEEGVFLVSGGVARWRAVSTGLRQAGFAEVLSGLEGKERIVVTGADDLTDGIPVEILD